MATRGWDEALASMRSDRAREALGTLWEGHRRFRSGESRGHRYTAEGLRTLAGQQSPLAAIVACSDSRVAPEIVFDQPLGAVFASRVPGNVASDSAKWMLDIAVAELRVPLVLVLGHTGCLAVGQILKGTVGGSGGSLRLDVQKAVHRARRDDPGDLYRAAVEANAALTVENLRRDSYPVQRAVERGELEILGAVYDMETGSVELLA